MPYTTNGLDFHIQRLLLEGKVGCMPSDTIYGLSCRALDRQAVEKLHQIKGRPYDKPFIILVSDIKMLDLLSISSDQAKIAGKYWPGQLTMICPAEHPAKWLDLGLGTLAVRVPDNEALLKLISNTGPLISTSANPNREKPAETINEARKYFRDQLDFYVDTGRLSAIASTIVRLNNDKLEVVRPGAVTIKE